MGFFDGDGDEGAGNDESRAGVEAGGISAEAQSRLRSLLGPDPLFTSTLGVGEFALLSDLGCVPLGQVMGASVHQVGWQYLPAQAQWGGEVFCSLDLVAWAWDDARQRAFARLAEEALVLGADAVVGVRLRRGEHDWARDTVDYVVSGTGVRGGQAGGATRPVLSDLSVQDFWKLAGRGWGPAGLVAATAVFFVAQSSRARRRRRFSAFRNQELGEFSRGFVAARNDAVASMRRQARTVGADGVVGVRLSHDVSRARIRVAMAVGRQRTGLSPTTIGIGAEVPTEGRDKRAGIVVTIHAVGTAIRRGAAGTARPPETVVRLGGGS